LSEICDVVSFSLHISGRGWARWNIDVSTWIDTRSLDDDDDDDDDASLKFAVHRGDPGPLAAGIPVGVTYP